MNSTCSACRFYQHDKSECHRHPPQFHHAAFRFPFVDGDKWCGEHQPIPAPPVVTTTTEVWPKAELETVAVSYIDFSCRGADRAMTGDELVAAIVGRVRRSGLLDGDFAPPDLALLAAQGRIMSRKMNSGEVGYYSVKL